MDSSTCSIQRASFSCKKFCQGQTRHVASFAKNFCTRALVVAFREVKSVLPNQTDLSYLRIGSTNDWRDRHTQKQNSYTQAPCFTMTKVRNEPRTARGFSSFSHSCSSKNHQINITRRDRGCSLFFFPPSLRFTR
ncbi:hypothetical protein K0M31_009497 [Melipona bicolor]|uniref:Uncharacterized protein n=1 Tax=Melipona bicolor TaxID=60889 RepID=A0AA40FNZ3_9HYME|nr:hypothetical protein K0M31_009497 [Melipona bicolor]